MPGRLRQVRLLAAYLDSAVPHGDPLIVAGDFNDWGERLDAPMQAMGLKRAVGTRVRPTFPSRVPVLAPARIYTRQLACQLTHVPRGAAWARMSDHLPLVAEFELAAR